MKQLKIYFLVGMFFAQSAYAQLPSSSFTSPTSACLQEGIMLTNSSTNANSYQWDLCADDFQTLQSNVSIATLTGLTNGFGYKLVEDNGNWYAFIVSQGGLRLFRTDFGNSPLNTPIQTIDLGNPGNTLSFPQDIEIYKANGKWYGFVGSNDNGYGVVRLDFGTSIINTPTALNIGTFGVFGRFWDLKVVEQNSNLILVINDRNTGSLIRINYRNSFDNTITNATHVFVTSSNTTNLSPGFDLIQNNGNWIALLTSYLDNKLYQINFGNDLFATPTLQSSFSLPTFTKPMRVRVVAEGNHYIGVVSNESSAISIVDLKDLNPTNTPTLISQSGLPNFLGLDVERFNGKSIVVGVGSVDNKVRQLIFESDCGVTPSFLTTTSPAINYSTSGTKVIELKAINTTTELSALSSRTVTITSAMAPDIDFSIANSCVNAPINFSAVNSSGNITSYNWNFGDGNVATGNIPQHTYSSTATYPISLQVNSSTGCTNRVTKTHDVYSLPQANFTLPTASPFCTNREYQFINTSSFDAGATPTWQWSINGSSVSTTKDLVKSFSASISQQVSLVASIPGCSTQSIQTINSLSDGPLVNFNTSTSCQGSPISFTNTTSGAVTSYSWTFGDGNTSSSISPMNTYLNFGAVNVTLQASNAAGCQNTITKPLLIYSKPLVDFSIGLPPFSCAGSPSQFTDGTPPPPDSNLTSWVWSFGDAANGSANSKNPTYTYSTSNTYNVSLTIGTNFGCLATSQKLVTIAPAPVAAFTNLPACTNQFTQFTDTSTGSIKSRLWQIQGSTFTSPTPQFNFSAAGSFPVSLTVTATNNCVSQINKNIIVPVVPALDFSVQAPCTNSSTTFTEIASTVDPSVSQSWAFGSIANGSGNPAQFSFATAANYSIRLNSTRQSGCVYSISKNVSIINAPISDFAPSTEAGTAPLLVSFTNNSTPGNSYLWNFGDSNNSSSIIESPTFLFTALGNYSVQLITTNTLGCSSQSSKIIRVVIPAIDVQLSDFYFFKDGTGALQPVVTILNKSNVSITDPTILVEVGAGVKKKITGTIKPNEELTQMLDFQIVPQSLQYVCAEVQVTGDTDLFQNRKCLSLNGEEVIFSPYPNPAQAELNMDWISLEGSPVSIQIVNSSGSISFQQTVTAVGPGINRLLINTSNLALGIYYIRFSDNKTAKAFSFAIAAK